MESLDNLKKSVTDLYGYIESARGLTRQSLVVDAYFKLQGCITKFFEVKEAIDQLSKELGLPGDNDKKKGSNSTDEGNTGPR